MRLAVDYSAEFPLWGEWPVGVRLPDELSVRLRGWQQHFDENFRWDSGWSSAEARDDFAAQAASIAADLRLLLADAAELEVSLWPLPGVPDPVAEQGAWTAADLKRVDPHDVARQLMSKPSGESRFDVLTTLTLLREHIEQIEGDPVTVLNDGPWWSLAAPRDWIPQSVGAWYFEAIAHYPQAGLNACHVEVFLAACCPWVGTVSDRVAWSFPADRDRWHEIPPTLRIDQPVSGRVIYVLGP